MERESPDNPASNAMTTNEPVPGEEYETLYTRLQQIVEQLETGDLPLARALALYEEGVATAEACQRLLDQAALRVRTLMGDQLPAAAEADV
jgi:exodeoxyribonuclease VII small subunit